MTTGRPRTKSAATRRPRTATRRARGAGATTGCTYVPEWRVLSSTRGYVQAWVPRAAYDRAMRYFVRMAKDEATKQRLRRRAIPVGVTHTCSGTCDGGWCKEVEIPQSATSAVYVCECSYFV